MNQVPTSPRRRTLLPVAALGVGLGVLLYTLVSPLLSPATQAPPRDDISWLHGQVASLEERARVPWHQCRHGCQQQTCHKLCHYR